VRTFVDAVQESPISIAIIRNNLRYIYGRSAEELYDLRADPEQEENLAPSFSNLVELRTLAKHRFAAGIPGEATELSEELRQRLQTLGYIQ
jgi:hypothetical protein